MFVIFKNVMLFCNRKKFILVSFIKKSKFDIKWKSMNVMLIIYYEIISLKMVVIIYKRFFLKS